MFGGNLWIIISKENNYCVLVLFDRRKLKCNSLVLETICIRRLFNKMIFSVLNKVVIFFTASAVTYLFSH